MVNLHVQLDLSWHIEYTVFVEQALPEQSCCRLEQALLYKVESVFPGELTHHV